MYLILDSKNLIKEICEKPCYVRRQANGVVILTERVNADAIYSSETDSFYPVERIGYLCDSHRLVEVDNVPENVTAGYWYFDCGQFYTTEAKLKALARAKSPDVAGLMFVSMAQEGKFDDTTIAEHAEQFQQWKVNISYSVGDICARDGKLYRCLQAHTSQADWTPDTAVSLFKAIGDLQRISGVEPAIGAVTLMLSGIRYLTIQSTGLVRRTLMLGSPEFTDGRKRHNAYNR